MADPVAPPLVPAIWPGEVKSARVVFKDGTAWDVVTGPATDRGCTLFVGEYGRPNTYLWEEIAAFTDVAELPPEEPTRLARTYIFEEPDFFIDTPPELPEGASEWERQEAKTLWSSALSSYRNATSRLHDDYVRLLREPAGTMSNRPAGNDVQSLGQAMAARSAYIAHVYCIEHRLALADRS